MKVAGFGYRRDANASSLADALDLATQVHGEVDCLAVSSGTLESSETLTCTEDRVSPKNIDCVKALSLDRNIPLKVIDESALRYIPTVTQSEASIREKGTGSVAEAVALAAVGNGRLLGPRVVSSDRMATCAVAEGGTL